MAFTQAKVKSGVFGDMRYEIWTCTFTGVEDGNLVTGLNNIDGYALGPSVVRASMTADHTSTAGTLAIVAATATDVITVTVWG